MICGQVSSRFKCTCFILYGHRLVCNPKQALQFEVLLSFILAVISIQQRELPFTRSLSVSSGPLHSHTHRIRTYSPLFGINSHRYWSVQAVPLGKVILHLSPPTSPTPQYQPSVAFTALWGWEGIPLDFSLTACQYCHCHRGIDVLGHLCISIHIKDTYTGLISL